MSKIQDFKTELAALLEKYNASIDCDIDGDTHGVSTTMVVEMDKMDYKICCGCSIEHYDLK